MHTPLYYWLAASLNHFSPKKFLTWLTSFEEDITRLFKATSETLKTVGLTPVEINKLKTLPHTAIFEALTWAREANHHLITFADPLYPVRLKEITDPPLVLYVLGNVALLNQQQLAMVGSRHPSFMGVKIAESFAKQLTTMGLVITSGLALGIDAAAHRGALLAEGSTIGVAGTGLYHCYPRVHQKLLAEMIHAGNTVISEFPLDTKPLPQHFPRRNRIIAGMSRGVLVVEAVLKSGSLITAREALEYGREVFAIPGSIYQPTTKGCHYLIKQGAKLVEEINDILEELPGLKLQPLQENTEKLPENCSNNDILSMIGYEITPIDVIILRSRLTRSEVSSILLKLELAGCIQSIRGGYMRVNQN